MVVSWKCIRHWLPFTSASLALMCGAVYTFRCETVAVGQDENRYQYGVWYRKPSPYEYYATISDNNPDNIADLDWAQHIRGGSGNYASSGGDCYSYDGETKVDGLWKLLRAMSLIAFLLGSGWAAWMFLCNTLCRHRGLQISSFSWNIQVSILGICLIVLQGLGFLFTKTNACAFSDVPCEWSTGLRANIAAVLLWTITAALAFCLGPPPAIARSSVGQETPVVHTITYLRNKITGEIAEKETTEPKN